MHVSLKKLTSSSIYLLLLINLSAAKIEASVLETLGTVARSVTLKGVEALIAAGLPLYSSYRSYPLFTSKIEIDNKPGSPEIHTFIQEIIKPLGIRDERPLYVLCGSNYHSIGAMGLLDKLIITVNLTEQEVSDFISKYEHKKAFPDSPMDSDLAIFIGTIQHEAGHLKHDDSLYGRVVQPAAVSIGVYAALNLAQFFQNYLSNNKFSKITSFTRALGGSVMKGFACSIVTELMLKALLRQQEARADTYVQDDPEVLYALYDKYNQFALEAKGSFYKNALVGLGSLSFGESLQQFVSALNESTDIFAEHPLHKKRATYYKERIKQLFNGAEPAEKKKIQTRIDNFISHKQAVERNNLMQDLRNFYQYYAILHSKMIQDSETDPSKKDAIMLQVRNIFSLFFDLREAERKQVLSMTNATGVDFSCDELLTDLQILRAILDMFSNDHEEQNKLKINFEKHFGIDELRIQTPA